MPYLVSLVDISLTIPPDNRNRILSTLQSWFAAAGATRTPSMPVSVGWTTSPVPQNPNVVIYFVASFHQSVLFGVPHFTALAHWGVPGGLTVLSNPEGNYRPGGIHASEVYLDKWETPNGIAVAAFHEAMHNQLRVGTEMHFDPGNYGGGVAAEAPGESAIPSPSNLRRYGTVMDLNFSQLLTGHPRHPVHVS